MTIADIRKIYQHNNSSVAATFDAYPNDVTPAEFDFLLMAVTGLSRAALHAHAEKTVTTAQQQQLQHWVKRLKNGEPLAYLVGHQPFFDLDLTVTADTLIPRPETEQLVAWVLSQYDQSHPLKVLDLGTGSGAIALALAVHRPDWCIDATDISAAALVIAQKNARKYQADKVCFYQGAWFAALPNKLPYDLIVSNPPYIAANDPHLSALRYEPQSALVAPSAGLADLAIIIKQAKHYLKPGGGIVIEHGYQQREAVRELLLQADYRYIIAHDDLASLPRFVTASLSSIT